MHINTTENKTFESISNKTILDSALNAGLFFEYSCKNGQCGVCQTTLVKGEVEETQPQIALTSEDLAAKKILTCCCTPTTDILIDAIDLSALHGIETKTLPARISSIKKHTTEIIEVTLRLPPTANFMFLEGQYLDVILGDLRRSYSIASTASQKEITLLIKRFENGKMSDYWFNQAKENDLVRIEGPKGTFFLRDFTKPLVFLATGTGIAPIISILQKLDTDSTYQQAHKVTVYWGNRCPEEFVWQPNFQKLNVELIKVCSTLEQTDDFVYGYVQDVALAKETNLIVSDIYACGSNAMIQSAKKLFINAGLPVNQFYSDAFVQTY